MEALIFWHGVGLYKATLNYFFMKTLIFLCFLSLFGKNLSEARISYRELTWADFRGKIPGTELLVAARSTTQLELNTIFSGTNYHFRVKAYFLPDSSFVRIRTDQNLRHEQTHFKIACIEALKCMQGLVPMQGGDSLDNVMATALYDYHTDQSSRINDQFDLETNHGQDREAEREWEAKISRELLTFETLSKTSHGGNR